MTESHGGGGLPVREAREARVGPPTDHGAADVRRSSLPLPLDPFGVVDLVLRNVVPGHWGVEPRRPGGTARASGPRSGRAARGGPGYTRPEAAARAGLTVEELGRLWRALGFAELPDGSPGFSEADVDAVREVADLAREGLVDLDEVVRMVRPMGHLVSRLGAAHVSALAGLVERDGTEAAEVAGDRVVPLLERLVVHAWRRHLVAAASATDPVRRLDDAGDPRAVGFVDIVSYTARTRRLEWSELAELLDRFEACVFERVATAGGRVVKTLGDEVLFEAPDAAVAAGIALAVVDAPRDDPALPAVHAGLAYGPLLERAGDVFGPAVNVAARVTELAHAGTVLVDTAFMREIEADPRFRLQRRPRRPVRGYPSLATFRLRHADSRARASYPRAG